MSNQYEFQCPFCGKNFGSEVIDLAKHIGKQHDPSRSWLQNRVDSIIRMNEGLAVSRIQQIGAWIAIIGGGIGFFFFSMYAEDFFRWL